MKKAINILIITVCVALPWSCDEGFLNTQPLDKVSSEAVWSDGSLSQAFVYNVYSFLGYGGFEEQAWRPLQMKPCLPMQVVILTVLQRVQKVLVL